MTKNIACPGCQKPMRVSEDKIGKRGRCPKCGAAIEVSADGTVLGKDELPPRVEKPSDDREPQHLVEARKSVYIPFCVFAIGMMAFAVREPDVKGMAVVLQIIFVAMIALLFVGIYYGVRGVFNGARARAPGSVVRGIVGVAIGALVIAAYHPVILAICRVNLARVMRSLGLD